MNPRGLRWLTLASLIVSACAPPSREKRAEPRPPPIDSPSEPPSPPPSSSSSSSSSSSQIDIPISQRSQVISTIWSSEFGKMYREYMEGSLENDEIASRAKLLSQWIFREGGPSVAYVSALQLMTEDLLEHNRWDQEQVRRHVLLSGELAQMRADTASHAGQGLAYFAAETFLLALPLGSPQVRLILKYWISRTSRLARKVVSSESLNFFAHAKRAPLSSLLSGDVIKDYSLAYALNKYFSFMGPFTAAHFYWFDWKESTRGRSIENELDRVDMSPEEFQVLLEQLSRL